MRRIDFKASESPQKASKEGEFYHGEKTPNAFGGQIFSSIKTTDLA